MRVLASALHICDYCLCLCESFASVARCVGMVTILGNGRVDATPGQPPQGLAVYGWTILLKVPNTGKSSDSVCYCDNCYAVALVEIILRDFCCA